MACTNDAKSLQQVKNPENKTKLQEPVYVTEAKKI